MSSEKIIQRLAKAMDRRSFLGKAGASALGTLMALLGVSSASALYTYKCCHLCRSPSPSCNNCACVWCWICPHSDGKNYQCCECHTNTSYCDAGCSNVNCSWGYLGPLLGSRHAANIVVKQ